MWIILTSTTSLITISIIIFICMNISTWLPILLMKILTKLEFILKMDSISKYPFISISRTLSHSSAFFRQQILCFKNTAISFDPKKFKLVIVVQELKILVRINYIYLDCFKTNIMGIQGSEYVQRLTHNLKPIIGKSF